MIKKCILCGGKVVQKEIVECHEWGGEYLVVFTDVPAEVCSFCGESYMSGDVLHRLHELAMPLIKAAGKPKKGSLAFISYKTGKSVPGPKDAQSKPKKKKVTISQ